MKAVPAAQKKVDINSCFSITNATTFLLYVLYLQPLQLDTNLLYLLF